MNNSKSFFNVVLVLGLIVLIVVLYNYNNKKTTRDNMYSAISDSSLNSQPHGVVGASPDTNFLNVGGMNSNKPSTCNQQTTDPSDLLPKDVNSEWSNINPANADLKNINLLSAGQLIGINTVGSSLRNPNLQERSEPVIPKTNIGPWNNSTIDADNLRRPLEIGSGDF
jgi:hypothetical protein